MPLNFDLGGKTYDRSTVTVTAEQIADYAAASGDDNPRHTPGDDQIASPVFPVVYGSPGISMVALDPELGVENPLMIIHGEQRLVHHRPVRPGETLELTPSLESVEDKSRSAVFVAAVRATTPDGEPVNDQYSTIVVRGGGSGGERARSTSKASPDPGEPRATFVRHVPTDMPSRYAAASGDHNPIHLDDAIATAVGLPGVINHGLGTLSLVVGGIVAEVLEGDAAGVRAVEARFTDLVIPGSDLTTSVWESDGEGVDFETRRPDGAVVVTGRLGTS
ncbi:MAG TPA: MaoC/PaaZ C-terminal domain-containing protein [Acidimicrobiia bacterium]|nr:MaoC/PaaZ C-terminal domain-containing protein [Acidimicrobiia bacterium]